MLLFRAMYDRTQTAARHRLGHRILRRLLRRFTVKDVEHVRRAAGRVLRVHVAAGVVLVLGGDHAAAVDTAVHVTADAVGEAGRASVADRRALRGSRRRDAEFLHLVVEGARRDAEFPRRLHGAHALPHRVDR